MDLPQRSGSTKHASAGGSRCGFDEKSLTEDGRIHCRSYCGADRRINRRAAVLRIAFHSPVVSER